jgi:hypothetical protein
LVKSLDENLSPLAVKTRLIVSGDLLEPKPHTVEPWSLSRLNIPAALYLWDDYLRLDLTSSRGPHSAPVTATHEYLGSLIDAKGIGCANEPNGHYLQDMWSIKRGHMGQFLYPGRRVSDSMSVPCALEMPSGSEVPKIIFQPEYEIIGGHLSNLSAGKTKPPPQTIPLSAVESLVRGLPQPTGT